MFFFFCPKICKRTDLRTFCYVMPKAFCEFTLRATAMLGCPSYRLLCPPGFFEALSVWALLMTSSKLSVSSSLCPPRPRSGMHHCTPISQSVRSLLLCFAGTDYGWQLHLNHIRFILHWLYMLHYLPTCVTFLTILPWCYTHIQTFLYPQLWISIPIFCKIKNTDYLGVKSFKKLSHNVKLNKVLSNMKLYRNS